MNKIAILGATSHIAKGIINNFIEDSRANELVLFARSIENVKSFLEQIKCAEVIPVFTFSEFSKGHYSAIINCVGFGNPNTLINVENKIFEVTEIFDNMIIEKIKTFPESIYINFSSGAVYGDFNESVRMGTIRMLNPNIISHEQNYGIVKLYSEIKHRSYINLNIVDLRIFSYFSRFIDLNAGYLLSDVAKCILNKTVLTTKKEDIIRDYVHSKDLYQLILHCLDQRKINVSFDVYSKNPVSKFDLLNHLKNEFGLEYIISDINVKSCPTGIKKSYYSENKAAEVVGYNPKYSSIEVIIKELRLLISNHLPMAVGRRCNE